MNEETEDIMSLNLYDEESGQEIRRKEYKEEIYGVCAARRWFAEGLGLRIRRKKLGLKI